MTKSQSAVRGGVSKKKSDAQNANGAAEETADDPLRGMARSFAVLDFLATSPGRVVDVMRNLNLPWATVHRTLIQLEKAQFLRRDPESNRYEIGPRLWHIGSAYLANHRALKAATPYLARLENEEGIATQVVERIGFQSVAIYSHQRAEEDITKAQYGYHFPLHCGSKGLVLLANEEPEFIEEYLARDLERLTPDTVTDSKRLRSILKQVKAEGISLTIGDVQPFTGSIAAPIYDSSGRVIACVSFVFRKSIAKSTKRLDTLRDLLLETAHSISLDLGWRPGTV